MHSKVRINNWSNKGNDLFNNILFLSFILILTDQFLLSDIGPILKVHDIGVVLVVIFCAPIINMVWNDQKLKQICLIALIYFLYLIITNLLYISIYQLWFKHIFYILKEMEFFLIFLLTIFTLRKNKRGKITYIIKFLVILNIIYGFYQIFLGKISYYGIGSIVSSAPSVSGNVYFISALIMFYFYKTEKRLYLLLSTFLLIILTFFTVSRTYIILIFLFISVYLVARLFLKNNKFSIKKIIVSIFFFNLILIILLFNLNFSFSERFSINISDNTFVSQIINRMDRLEGASEVRKNKSKYYYDTFVNNNSFILLFGKGKGITEQEFNKTTLAVDNQYVRALIEMGIMGIAIWAFLIFKISLGIKDSGNLLDIVFFMGLFCCYLAASIGTEVFQTTRPGVAFWFTIGILYSMQQQIRR